MPPVPGPQHEASAAMDHRWGTRFTVELPVEMHTVDGRLIPAVVADASLSGAFVRTGRRMPVLSVVAVRTPADPDGWLEATVVRHDGTGMGIEWLDTGLRPISALLAMCNPAGRGADPAAARIVTGPRPDMDARAPAIS